MSDKLMKERYLKYNNYLEYNNSCSKILKVITSWNALNIGKMFGYSSTIKRELGDLHSTLKELQKPHCINGSKVKIKLLCWAYVPAGCPTGKLRRCLALK